jgi:putative glycosyltransferase (TIGR04372 family)
MARKHLLYSLPLINRIGHLTEELFWARNIFPEDEYDITALVKPLKEVPAANSAVYRLVFRYFDRIETTDDTLLMMAYNEKGPEKLRETEKGTLVLYNAGEILDMFVRGLEHKQPRHHYSLNSQELAEGLILREKFGIPAEAKVVTLHVREGGYLPNLPYHSFRDANIENYYPAINFLVDSGYYIVRIGDKSMKPLIGFPRQVIDAPFHPAYTPLVEPYFIATCFFHFGSVSGPSGLAHVFEKPTLFANTPLLACDWGGEFDMYAPKVFYSEKLQRNLSYLEIICSTLVNGVETPTYDNAGIRLIENSPRVLLSAAQEMVARLQGQYGTSSEAVSLDNAIRSVQRMGHAAQQSLHSSYYGLYFSKTRISHAFVGSNPWFLSHFV